MPPPPPLKKNPQNLHTPKLFTFQKNKECEKANILNDFFKDQTLLDEKNAQIPDIHSYPVDSPLSNIVLTSDEVESV